MVAAAAVIVVVALGNRAALDATVVGASPAPGDVSRALGPGIVDYPDIAQAWPGPRVHRAGMPCRRRHPRVAPPASRIAGGARCDVRDRPRGGGVVPPARGRGGRVGRRLRDRHRTSGDASRVRRPPARVRGRTSRTGRASRSPMPAHCRSASTASSSGGDAPWQRVDIVDDPPNLLDDPLGGPSMAPSRPFEPLTLGPGQRVFIVLTGAPDSCGVILADPASPPPGTDFRPARIQVSYDVLGWPRVSDLEPTHRDRRAAWTWPARSAPSRGSSARTPGSSGRSPCRSKRPRMDSFGSRASRKAKERRTRSSGSGAPGARRARSAAETLTTWRRRGTGTAHLHAAGPAAGRGLAADVDRLGHAGLLGSGWQVGHQNVRRGRSRPWCSTRIDGRRSAGRGVRLAGRRGGDGDRSRRPRAGRRGRGSPARRSAASSMSRTSVHGDTRACHRTSFLTSLPMPASARWSRSASRDRPRRPGRVPEPPQRLGVVERVLEQVRPEAARAPGAALRPAARTARPSGRRSRPRPSPGPR